MQKEACSRSRCKVRSEFSLNCRHLRTLVPGRTVRGQSSVCVEDTSVDRAVQWTAQKPTATPNGTGLAVFGCEPALVETYTRISNEKNAQDKLVRDEKETAEKGKRMRNDRLERALTRTTPRSKVPKYNIAKCSTPCALACRHTACVRSTPYVQSVHRPPQESDWSCVHAVCRN
jgi:hypothetical protein